MSQISAVTLTTTPQDVSDDLEGLYLAQCRPQTGVALYATRDTAPDDTNDYFELTDGRFMTFRAGSGCTPTWVRLVDAQGAAKLAIAKIDD